MPVHQHIGGALQRARGPFATLFSGASDPRLSEGQNAGASRQAIIDAGLSAILAGSEPGASALASISLIWDDTGTSSYTDPTGSIVLNVMLNSGPDPLTTHGGQLTIDYSAALSELGYVSASTPGDLDFSLPPGPADTGTQVQTFSAISLLWQPAGVSVLMGTITFSVTAGAPGVFTLTSLELPGDLIEGLDPGPGGLGTASITRTPEPGTLSLLVMGLSGLYVVGRRRGR